MKWTELFNQEFKKEYFITLNKFVSEAYSSDKNIFPPKDEIYAAFDNTPFEEVRVVILGQDPYHGKGQAHGLAFSVQDGIKLPPSLRNIFKEYESDLGITAPQSGNLTNWSQRGVLLLNTVLTVEESKAGSHQKMGWEIFTDTVIKTLSEKREGLVFILWGAPAQTKKKLIDLTKHHIIESVHPSPLSSYRGFFGSKPFSKTNKYLEENGRKAINWEL